MAGWDDVSSPLSSGSGQDWDSVSTAIGIPRVKPTPAMPPKEEEKPTLIGAGWEGLKGDVKTGAARLLQSANMPEWAKATEESAKANYDIQARRPIKSLDDDMFGGIYEGAVSSLPGMGPVFAGGAAGAKIGALGGPWGAGIGAVVGGAAAALPQFLGSNLKRQQQEQNIPLEKTNLADAALTAAGQSSLDSVINLLMPGVGKALGTGMFLRAARKGVEGMGVEATTEAAQQWLEILQANPEKALAMPPEVRKELTHAAIIGGVVGGGVGAASGAVSKRAAAPSPVAEEPPTDQALPPPVEYWPDGTGFPVPSSGTGLPDPGSPTFPLPISPGYMPQGTGLPYVPGTLTAPGLESGTGLPDFQKTDPPWIPQGTGLPRQAGDPAPGLPSGTGLPEGNFRMPPTGQKVYKDVQQRLLAAGRKPIVANAEAKLWRERYEALGQQIGTDAYSAYKQSGVDITQGTKAPTNQAATGSLNQMTLNQDVMRDQPLVARHYSALGSVLNRLPMKQGTGQQWLNALKKQGVKDEELVWTGMQDYLGGKDALSNKFSANEVQSWFKPYALATYEAKPLEQGKKNHYGEWTLGGYGLNPESNYREVVIADDNQREDTYKSPHYGMVPNALAHYRTTDRTSADGSPVLLAEEFQSDWHQAGVKRGYASPEAIKIADDRVMGAFRKLAQIVKAVHQLETPREIQNTVEKYLSEGGANNRVISQAVDDFRVARDLRDSAASAPPDAPFKQTWPNLTFRHALMDAINMGKEYVAWPTGEQQNARYGNPTEERLRGMQQFYDKRMVDYANKLGKQFGSKVEQIDIPGGTRPVLKRGDVISWRLFPNMRVEITTPDGTVHNHNINSLEDRGAISDAFPSDVVQKLWDASYDFSRRSKTPIEGTATIDQDSKETVPFSNSVHALKITPQMRELISTAGLPLFQRGKTPQGNITIEPSKATIRLFKTANESTFMHESAHLWLEEMVRYAPQNRDIAADLTDVRKWLGNDGGPFTREQHEKFARGFEQYLRSGRAPTSALADVFKKFAEWLTKIYKNATSLGVEVPAHIEKVYDRLLTGGSESSLTGDERINASPAMTYSQDDSAFKRWFAGSKVVGPDGEPLKVYHGTSKDKDFGRFNVGRHGAWFTTDPESASSYAVENDSMNYRFENGRYEKTNTASRVMPVHLRIENPYRMTKEDSDRINRSGNSYKKAQSDFFDQLRRKGYDGVDYQNGVWVVLNNPQQIKSVHNRGTYSDSPLILNQDEDEKIAPNPIQKATNWLSRTFDPFSHIPGSEQYRDLRNLAAGGAYAAEQAATKAKNLFSKLTLAEKNAVNTYMETAGASPMSVPESVRKETVSLKQQINGPLKRALIDSGLLPEEAANKNDDSYLPRLYLKHLVEGEGITKGGRLNRNYAKKRGDRAEDELLAMGEVKDPGIRTYYALFRPLRDLKIMEFLTEVGKNKEWVLPESLVDWNGRNVTPQWLKDEADAIEGTRMLAEPDPARRQAMKELADRMRQAARDGLAALGEADYDNKEYTKLPDTRDFGPLRGMIVRKQIADDITGAVNFVRPDNWFDKWFGDRQSVLTKAMSVWKFMKVPLNPPSQVRNVVSNMILLNLSGIPIHKVAPRMVQAARDMAKDGPYYQIAKKYGVGQGTFSEQELYGISDELKRLEITDQSGLGGWKKVYKAMLKGADKVGDLYQRMEVWGKVAKIMDAMEREGMNEADAVRQANKWLFDYSEVPQAVRRARQSPIGYPFLTFTYKVMPLMAEVAAKHPTRLLPYIALAYTIPAMVAASFDIEEDDPEKLKKSLSQGLRRKNDMYLLPWKDDDGRWQFVDIGYFMPWQMPVDMARNLGKGAYKTATGDTREGMKDLGAAVGSANVLSNPLFNVVSALTTGVDPFTERPIADKRDPPRKQVMDILGYVWGLAMPSLLAPYGAAGQLLSKEQGTGMNRFGEPSNTYGQIGARAFGINTYPVVPEAQRGRNIQMMQRELQEIKSRLTYTLKDQSLTAEQRRNIVGQFQETMRDRAEEMMKYIKESQPSARLQAASR